MGIVKKKEIVYISIDKDNCKMFISDGDENIDIDGIEGTIINVYKSKYELQDGKIVYKLNVLLEDDETYCISFGFYSQTAQNLINVIAGLKNILGTSLYVAYYKKNGYPKIYIRANNEQAKWKYDIEDIPKIEYITNSVGEKFADKGKRNAFFEKVFESIVKKIEKEKNNDNLPF